MPRRFWRASLLMFALGGSAAAHACAAASWDCTGAIEMHVGGRAFRMSKCANDEMLAAIDQGSIRQ